MPRNRKGSIWYEKVKDPKTGKRKVVAIYGRVTFTDEHGRRRDRKRKAVSGTRTEAWEHVKDLLKELDEQGERSLDGARMTFNDLAEYYKEHYLTEAEYNTKGEKVAGLRSWRDMRRKIGYAQAHFGKRKAKSITYADLVRYKNRLLRKPVLVKYKVKEEVDGRKVIRWEERESPRSVSTVNRELAAIRRMFSVAVQEGWLSKNPFGKGEALIDIALEVPRERIATKKEEGALLLEASGHLGDFLVCAFDTGMRAGEVFRLERRDVNLETNEIRAVSYKGKRRTERWLKMTTRLRVVCERLCQGLAPDEKLFKVGSVRRSFATAKRRAGLKGVSLDDFRLHDIRHTATTRLLKGHMPLSEAGKLMGHTQPTTTWRYNNPDEASRDKAAEILESFED
ncbi:MAG TPA: site-specific integrase [Pyrinomonadaceae bacterium]|nr:site-specific integrase [Pyrinomonadaceae bacterium]